MAKQSAAKVIAEKTPAEQELLNDLGSIPEIPDKSERAAEQDDPGIEQPVPKATRVGKAKAFAFDSTSGILTINDQHGSFETSLMGINPRVEWQLAAIGLASLLKGRIDKDKVIENIRAGQFGGKRKQKYPATVIAYANYQNITVEEAWTQWQSLSVPERMQIRSMPKVRLELAKLADIAEAVDKT